MIPHRVAIIGGGSWAESHILAWRSIPGVTITHLVGHRDLGKTEALARRHGIPNPTLDLLELANPGDIDLLDVVTPPTYRLAALVLAEQLQIPRVNLEKPIALTKEELHAVAAFIREHSSAVVVNHQKRFLPGIAWALSAIAEGRIGQVLAVSGTCRGSLDNQANHVLDLVGQIVDIDRLSLASESLAAGGDTTDSDDGTGATLVYGGSDVDVNLTVGEHGRWIAPGPYWLQVGVDVLGSSGSISFGINRTSLLLSATWPHVESADVRWERDQVAAERAHLEFCMNASPLELDLALARAIRVNDLLLEVSNR